MARPLRIEYPGAWYHVMNRGRRKEPIFFEERDCSLFLKILKEAYRMFKIEIHAYALMPNHYHLLVRTPLGNLSRAMRHINGLYTQKINNKYKIDGSLFRGRYKSIIVNAEEYLLEVVRYIHRNPFKAGLEEEIGKYTWCSHKWYMREDQKPDFLHVKHVLKMFSRYEREAKRELGLFVRKEVPNELIKKLESIKWPSILGGEEFKEKIKNMLKGKEIESREIPQYKNEIVPKKLWDEKNVRKFIEMNRSLTVAKRSRNFSRQRRAIVYLLKEKSMKTNKEIARLIGGITDASISWQYRKALKEVDAKKGCISEVKQLKKKLNF